MGAACCRRRQQLDLKEVIKMLPKELQEQVMRVNTAKSNKTPSETTPSRKQERRNYRRVVDDLLIIAAEMGNVRILKTLEKARLWDPRSRVDVLRIANEAGTASRLLQVFELPLAHCPSLVQLHDVLECFNSDEETFQTHTTTMSGITEIPSENETCHTLTSARVTEDNLKDWSPTIQPSRQAMLLANVLKMPCCLAEMTMNGIVEDMVVFQPTEKLRSRIRKTLRQAADNALPAQASRSSTNSDQGFTFIPMQTDTSELCNQESQANRSSAARSKPSGGRRPSKGLAALPSLPLKMNFPESLGAIFLQRRAFDNDISFDEERHELKNWPVHGHVTPSSPMFALNFENFPEETRRAAMIPMRAEKFAYLIGAPGGFVYFADKKVDGKYRIIAVNAIDFNFRGCAMSFGEFKPLSNKACKKLAQDKRWYDITVEMLREKGAIKYSFVGPQEVLADDFTAEPGGGYCYLFEDHKYNRYFPMIGAGEVMSRAEVPACSSINSVMLPESADGSDMQPMAHPKPYLSCNKRLVEGAPVRFARLRVPGILHPVVLHGLAFTPRQQVLNTQAARAIAQTAFIQHINEIAFDVVAEAMSLTAITRIAARVRSGTMSEAMPGVAAWPMVEFWLVVIMVVWFKNTTDEICLIMGYCYQGWASDYFTWQKSMVWVHSTGMLALWCWTLYGSVCGFSNTNHMRPLLALTGAMKWIRLLYAFRGTSTFRLGPRILPIIFALGEVTDFVLITMFFTGACAHVSYSLSENSTSLSSVLFSSYRLGFLADFEIPDDVFFIGEEDEPFKWQPFQTGAFVVFSFVVSIALTNIFIGVMSNAFDYHSERVGELFVRTRASIALDHALRGVGRRSLCHHICGLRLTGLHRRWISRDLRLWFCFKHVEEDPESDSLTVRGTINNMGEAILKKLEDLSKFDDLAKRLKALEVRMKPKEDREQPELHTPRPHTWLCASATEVVQEASAPKLVEAAPEPPTGLMEHLEVVQKASAPKLVEAAPEPPTGLMEHLEAPHEEPFAEPLGGSSSGASGGGSSPPAPARAEARGKKQEVATSSMPPEAVTGSTPLEGEAGAMLLPVPAAKPVQPISPRWQDMSAGMSQASSAEAAAAAATSSGPSVASDLASGTTHGSRCQPPCGQRLNVTIVRATGLCNVETKQERKAYCTCEVVGKPHTKMSTRPCGELRYPVWLHQDEIVEFEAGDALSFTVWECNSKTTGDKGDIVLGKALLDDKHLGWAGFIGCLPLDGACSFLRNGGPLQPEAMLQVQVARRGARAVKKPKRRSKSSTASGCRRRSSQASSGSQGHHCGAVDQLDLGSSDEELNFL